MATTAEIRNKALKRLGILGRGQTARSEDAADLDAAYAELHAMLQVKGLTPWGSATADIPAQYVNDVVFLLAFWRADEYSVSPAKYQRISFGAAIAETNIRELQALGIQAPTKTENY